ncbi:MAG: hypothetical protein HY073_00810 [Deltaproteobacteria bacterium]|nr:hypothetical protein [Deltaproteobacteria bacterium]
MNFIFRFFCILMAFLVLIGGVFAVSYVQKRFDEGDTKKAIQAVRVKFPEARECQAQVMSRVKGFVKVQCENRVWQVNVVNGTLSSQ